MQSSGTIKTTSECIKHCCIAVRAFNRIKSSVRVRENLDMLYATNMLKCRLCWLYLMRDGDIPDASRSGNRNLKYNKKNSVNLLESTSKHCLSCSQAVLIQEKRVLRHGVRGRITALETVASPSPHPCPALLSPLLNTGAPSSRKHLYEPVHSPFSVPNIDPKIRQRNPIRVCLYQVQ
jgi:hypothetical protein